MHCLRMLILQLYIIATKAKSRNGISPIEKKSLHGEIRVKTFLLNRQFITRRKKTGYYCFESRDTVTALGYYQRSILRHRGF